jgi:hypothetical protein
VHRPEHRREIAFEAELAVRPDVALLLGAVPLADVAAALDSMLPTGWADRRVFSSNAERTAALALDRALQQSPPSQRTRRTPTA